MIQVFKPSITQAEVNAVTGVLRSGWLGLGPKVAEFETRFAKYVGAKHAVATNSGTAALHLALLACGVGKGDEVLVPTITFVSTAHAVKYCGATPVFTDVEPDTLCMSVADAESRITNSTAVLLPVHYAGHPCDMDALWDLARRENLRVVEDAAHACGARYRGAPVGGLASDATCFSFHAVKNMTCGEGGMVTLDDGVRAERMRRLRWCGIDKSTWRRSGERQRYSWYYEVPELGYKCHMSDVNAAIGLVQLARLEGMNERRRAIARRYSRALRSLDWLELPVERVNCSSWHAYVVKTAHRDALNLYLKERGVATGVHYMPLHLQPYYRSRAPLYLPVAESVWTQLLTLPLYPDLSDEDVDFIIEHISNFKP